ncbi:MAG: hypothetical protein AAGK71_11445, partial [Pseudomonadota bacterium]
MELYASHHHVFGSGGGPVSFVADYLCAEAPSFGSAIEALFVEIQNNSTEPTGVLGEIQLAA